MFTFIIALCTNSEMMLSKSYVGSDVKTKEGSLDETVEVQKKIKFRVIKDLNE